MSVARIDALNERAWEIGLMEPERSKELAAEALARARASMYPLGQAQATRTLGYQHLLAGELDEAHRLSTQAAESLRRLEDKGGEASARNTLGIVYARLGDFEKSLTEGVASLRLFREVGDRRGEAWGIIEIGNVHLAVREHEPARQRFEEGRDLFEAIDYGPGMGRAWSLLGQVANELDEREEALRCYEKSLHYAREEGLTMSVAVDCSAIGRIHQALGDRVRAREYFREALSATNEASLRPVVAHVYYSLGRLELEEGNVEAASGYLREGLELVEGERDALVQSRFHEALADLHEAGGDLESALRHFRSSQRHRDERFDEDARTRLKNLQIRMEVEKAESQAEIERLRYVELAGMQTELVQSEKMALLGRLVAGLSHEMNTPVGVIKSNAALGMRALEVLLAEGLDPSEKPRRKKAIETLTASLAASATASERLAELVGSLKSYARLDESELQHADVGECVSDSVELFRTQLQGDTRLEVERRSVPKLLCRPGELNQAFMTLLVNASEAIGEDGTIKVWCGPDEDDVVVSIRDDGRGIPEENLGTLFEIDFSRKDSRMRLRMGLSNAKTIVERHGGRIDVESSVGEGTTFEIRLPRRSARVPHFGGGFARRRD